jgi:hypothetical protein
MPVEKGALGGVANPSGAWEDHVALDGGEQAEQQRLAPGGEDDLVWLGGHAAAREPTSGGSTRLQRADNGAVAVSFTGSAEDVHQLGENRQASLPKTEVEHLLASLSSRPHRFVDGERCRELSHVVLHPFSIPP